MNSITITKPTPIFLIWAPSPSGPICQLLHGLDQNKDSHGKDKKTILQQHELEPELRDLSLTQLALIYPYKGEI